MTMVPTMVMSTGRFDGFLGDETQDIEHER